jgi:cellobiose-specific phosphotransferase system component IIA
MGNRLFQEARQAVEMAKMSDGRDTERMIEKAKNALSSAYSNTTSAEQNQLSDLQKELEQLETR